MTVIGDISKVYLTNFTNGIFFTFKRSYLSKLGTWSWKSFDSNVYFSPSGHIKLIGGRRVADDKDYGNIEAGIGGNKVNFI